MKSKTERQEKKRESETERQENKRESETERQENQINRINILRRR